MHELNRQFDRKLDIAIAIFENRYIKPFLHQLISGQLDLDRMDYLKRDSFYSGVAEGNIGYDRIIKMLDVRDNHIVLEQKGRFTIEQFLMARRLMYWQVYLHKTGLAAERMLRRLIELTRDFFVNGGYIPNFPMRLATFLVELQKPDPNNPKPLLDEFAKLDDVDVMGALKVMAEYDDYLLSYLANGIISRRLFHTQFIDVPPTDTFKEKLSGKAAMSLDIPLSDARKLIIEGFESIPTYRTGSGEIQILMKDGKVVPLSNILELRHDAVRDANYLCYPKIIRD
jgi:HD superfamily phosphohydrolase